MTPDSDIRQVAPTIDGVRQDHVNRYVWARNYTRNRTVVDYGCGIGYGSWIMAMDAASVIGIDQDQLAIQYASKRYTSTGADFLCADIMLCNQDSAVAVAFEVLEHLEQPQEFLQKLDATTLLASVPNEHVFPYNKLLIGHHRHYTPEQFEQMLNDAGWSVLEWWGQEGPESDLVSCTQGRTIVVVAARTAFPTRGTWKNLPAPPAARYVVPNEKAWQHPTGLTPESVHLVGLGPSKYALTEAMLQHDFVPEWDELWTINTGINMFPDADVAWILDDVQDYAQRHPAYGEAMKNFRGKIIGQSTLPVPSIRDFVPFVEYPLDLVMDFYPGNPRNWVHTISVGFILAYAGFIGVKDLYLTGIDCSWPNRPDLSEAGNAVVCYWLGRLEALGMNIYISSESALNQTNQAGQYGRRKYYGYLKQPIG